MNSCLQFLRIKDYKEVRASVEIIRVFPGQKGCIVNEHKSRLCTLVCLPSVVWFSALTSDTWQLAHLAGERPSLVLTNLFAHWDESGVLIHQTAAGAMATWRAQCPSSFESLMECFLLALIYITALSLFLACVGPSFHTQASGIFSLLESLDSCLLGGCCTQRRFIVYCKARPCIAPSVPYRDLNEVELLFICFINIKLLEFELNSARITG